MEVIIITSMNFVDSFSLDCYSFRNEFVKLINPPAHNTD